MKAASETVPGAQLIFLRSSLALLMMLLLAWRQATLGQLPELAKKPLLLRAMADAGGTALYLFSLFQLPLANATAINQGAPLFMTVFAVLFLRERASWLRWMAVFIGFVGVLLVVQPRSEGFNAWAWLCLAGTLLHALRDLLTRRLDARIHTLTVAISGALSLGVLAAVLLLAEGRWQPVPTLAWGQIGLAALLLCAAFLLLIACLRLGELSLTAPLRYSSLLFAVLMGFALWGDVPNAMAWAGIALLVGSGLLVVNGERVRKKTPVTTGRDAEP